MHTEKVDSPLNQWHKGLNYFGGRMYAYRARDRGFGRIGWTLGMDFSVPTTG